MNRYNGPLTTQYSVAGFSPQLQRTVLQDELIVDQRHATHTGRVGCGACSVSKEESTWQRLDPCGVTHPP